MLAAGFDLSPLWMSLRVSIVAAAAVLVVGTLIAWPLAFWRHPLKAIVETVLTLPMVLPPTVVGYYLLLLLGRGTSWGRFLNDWICVRLLFTWEGAVVAATVMALPLMIKTASAAMESVDHELIEMARSLGASRWHVFWHVLIPLSYRGILAGLALAFARCLGEFGATLMVAGNIPGLTRTLPLAVYEAVQVGDGGAALRYSAILTATSFAVLWGVGWYQRKIVTRRAER